MRAPITPELVRAHVAGAVTLGAYLLRLDGTVTFFVLDLDATRRALSSAEGHAAQVRELHDEISEGGRALSARLAALGLSCVLEDSGYKGRHLWGLLAEPQPADLVLRLGRALVRTSRPASPSLALEFFPKQDRVAAGGLGNLVKLPLGVHRVTGRRAVFLDDRGEHLADPWPLLERPPLITRERLFAALEALREVVREDAEPGPGAGPSRPDPRGAVSVEALRGAPAVRGMLEGCPAVRMVVDRALAHRRLSHDEQVVLAHSLGHLAEGVALTNRLFERCPEVPLHARLDRPMRGHPISCARIRSRVPEITSSVACHCAFGRTDTYPTPLLHVAAPRED